MCSCRAARIADLLDRDYLPHRYSTLAPKVRGGAKTDWSMPKNPDKSRLYTRYQRSARFLQKAAYSQRPLPLVYATRALVTM
jgi:hypothetical protein